VHRFRRALASVQRVTVHYRFVDPRANFRVGGRTWKLRMHVPELHPRFVGGAEQLVI
jgi:hypothetical protein